MKIQLFMRRFGKSYNFSVPRNSMKIQYRVLTKKLFSKLLMTSFWPETAKFLRKNLTTL